MKKSLKNILIVGALGLALTTTGIIGYNFGSSNKQQEILEKFNKTLNIVGKKAIGKELDYKEDLSLQYFGHDVYMMRDLIEDSIGTDKIYQELMQRSNY